MTSIYAVNNQNFYYSWHRNLENTFGILNFSHFPWCFLYKHSAKCTKNSTHHLVDSPPVLESVPHLYILCSCCALVVSGQFMNCDCSGTFHTISSFLVWDLGLPELCKDSRQKITLCGKAVRWPAQLLGKGLYKWSHQPLSGGGEILLL